MFGASLPAVILLFPLKFHLICAQVLSQSRSWWGLLGGYFFPLASSYVWQRGAMRYTPVRGCVCMCGMHICVCLCLRVHISVCTQAHLIRLVCVRVCVCVCVCVCLQCSKVSHLSGRWLRVANGRLDRWVHCSTLAAVASAQVTASPAQWWCQCWWVAGGLTTLFWWQNDSAVRFTTSLAFFRFVSLYWEV